MPQKRRVINIYIIFGFTISLVIIILIYFLISYYKCYGKEELLDDDFDLAGFAYDEEQDIFYSELNAWQREYGYCKLYDELATTFGMVLDSEPIRFEYAGKLWLIEFWKGQYGITTGCEVGIYNADMSAEEPFNNTFYNSVSDKELLPISLNLEKKNFSLFTRSQRHWWLTGFKLGEFSRPSKLTMYITITLKDIEMCKAFVKQLQTLGYSANQFAVEGTTVKVIFRKPYNKQPFIKIFLIGWIVQRRNKRLCKIYRKLTKDYINTSDKLKIVHDRKPKVYRKIMNMGKSKDIFRYRR